eukprot:2689824-Amphidinium_carterae.1
MPCQGYAALEKNNRTKTPTTNENQEVARALVYTKILPKYWKMGQNKSVVNGTGTQYFLLWQFHKCSTNMRNSMQHPRVLTCTKIYTHADSATYIGQRRHICLTTLEINI